jgi:sulfonate transport system permease protein
MKVPPLAPGIGGVLIFLGLWEALVAVGALRYQYLPPPSQILWALAAMTATRPLAHEIAHTLEATFLGWILAASLGLSIGVLLGLSATARRYSLASIEVLRPLPGIAFVPLALLLFGFSLQMELVVIVLPALWPVLINTMGGILAVPQRLNDVARSLHLSTFDAARKVFVPAAAAAVLVGCRLSLSLALVMAVIAEMVGNPEGLGYAVIREQQAMQPSFMFAYIFLIGVLGIVFNALVVGAGRALLPGAFPRPAEAKAA